MTDAVLGAGSSLKLGDDATPVAYTLIAEVLRVGQIGQQTPEVDVTNLDSTSKEYIGGLPDGATVEFDINWIADNTNHEKLRDGVGDTLKFKMEWVDDSEAAFDMVVLNFMRGETTPEGQLTATVSGRITGDITWA
jgi:hypothetical protein